MSTLQRNTIANFASQLWTLVLSVVLVPVYVNILGIESYGLIGFFMTLNASVNLLDMGLSATMNREMARYSVRPELSDQARDLARTMEIVYWVIGVLIGIGVLWASPWIATSWLQNETIPTDELTRVVQMMGIAVVLQWPVSLYSGGIMGLERQVQRNVLVVALGTIRSLGVLAALWLIAPTVGVYFGWQVLVSLLTIVTFAWLFWRSLPKGSRRARFELPLLRDIWRFALGMGATGVVTFLLSQLDKVVLSRLLPLAEFGYYNIANQLNTATRVAPSSIFLAFLPRMSSLWEREDIPTLTRLYHSGCQFVAVVVLPASFVMAVFAHEIVFIWTGDKAIAAAVAPIASILIVGSALNSLIGMPYYLTVSSGWASFGFYQNLIAAAVLVPVMLVLAVNFGGVGAAVAWLLLNAGYILLSPFFIHRRLLNGELRRWYTVDVGRPLAISVALAILGRLFSPSDLGRWMQLLVIGSIWLLTLLACAISLPAIRQGGWRWLNDKKMVRYVFGRA